MSMFPREIYNQIAKPPSAAADSQAMPPVISQEAGLYVHFPYCERKCPYCDFNVHVAPHDDKAYAEAILSELRARMGAYERFLPFRSLYFGGGTPSEWDPIHVKHVITQVREEAGLVAAAEITLEANPGTISEARLWAFRDAGVTRFSLGVQSFHDHELEQLGRTHTGVEAERIVMLAKSTGARISIDLMYALPEQTHAHLSASIARAADLEPDHISAYTLTIEPATLFGRRVRLGQFHPMEDDLQADCMELACAQLTQRGYPQYEVSSFARPGREAIHNCLYWVGGAYLGLGAGAHSYLPQPGLVSGQRRENLRAPANYLQDVAAQRFSAGFEEQLSPQALIADRLFTGVRTRWGIDLEALWAESAASPELMHSVTQAVEDLIADGLMKWQGARVQPSPRGFLLGDYLGRILIASAQGASSNSGRCAARSLGGL